MKCVKRIMMDMKKGGYNRVTRNRVTTGGKYGELQPTSRTIEDAMGMGGLEGGDLAIAPLPSFLTEFFVKYTFL